MGGRNPVFWLLLSSTCSHSLLSLYAMKDTHMETLSASRAAVREPVREACGWEPGGLCTRPLSETTSGKSFWCEDRWVQGGALHLPFSVATLSPPGVSQLPVKFDRPCAWWSSTQTLMAVVVPSSGELWSDPILCLLRDHSMWWSPPRLVKSLLYGRLPNRIKTCSFLPCPNTKPQNNPPKTPFLGVSSSSSKGPTFSSLLGNQSS